MVKVKEISLSKGVTMGMPNYGSVRMEVSMTATDCQAKKLGEMVDIVLQREIDKTMRNLGQSQRAYKVVGNGENSSHS